jgi:hypothetical protein
MQILTISIAGQRRADLVQALAEVQANLSAGIDTANFENEQLSYSYAIREYESGALTDEPTAAELQQEAEANARAAARLRANLLAKFGYLPTDELMQAAGYEHYATGAYKHRPGPGSWPVHMVSFFSQSGNCVLGRYNNWQSDLETVAAEVVASDEQLLQLLQRHEFPPIDPISVGV